LKKAKEGNSKLTKKEINKYLMKQARNSENINNELADILKKLKL
jgi:hypothetical protein